MTGEARALTVGDMPTRVYGLDPSLSSTGVAGCELQPDDPTGVAWAWTDRVHVSSRGCERIDEIVRRVAVLLNSARSTSVGDGGYALVVIEGPIYHTPKLRGGDGERSPGLRGYHERAGLWWALVCRLKRMGIPFAVASPASIKKYATNNGNAGKELVLARAAQAFGTITTAGITSDDEADAFWAMLLGAHRLLSRAAIVGDADWRRDALDGVEWPTIPAALGWAGPLAALAFGVEPEQSVMPL